VLISQFSVRTAIFLKSEGLQLYNKTESEKELKPRRDDIITQPNQTDIFHCTQPQTFSIVPNNLNGRESERRCLSTFTYFPSKNNAVSFSN